MLDNFNNIIKSCGRRENGEHNLHVVVLEIENAILDLSFCLLLLWEKSVQVLSNFHSPIDGNITTKIDLFAQSLISHITSITDRKNVNL